MYNSLQLRPIIQTSSQEAVNVHTVVAYLLCALHCSLAHKVRCTDSTISCHVCTEMTLLLDIRVVCGHAAVMSAGTMQHVLICVDMLQQHLQASYHAACAHLAHKSGSIGPWHPFGLCHPLCVVCCYMLCTVCYCCLIRPRPFPCCGLCLSIGIGCCSWAFFHSLC